MVTEQDIDLLVAESYRYDTRQPLRRRLFPLFLVKFCDCFGLLHRLQNGPENLTTAIFSKACTNKLYIL